MDFAAPFRNSTFGNINLLHSPLLLSIAILSVFVMRDESYYDKNIHDSQTRFTMSFLTLISSVVIFGLICSSFRQIRFQSDYTYAFNLIIQALLVIMLFIAAVYLLADSGKAVCNKNEKHDILIEKNPYGRVQLKGQFWSLSQERGLSYIADDSVCFIYEEDEQDLSIFPASNLLRSLILGILSLISSLISFFNVGFGISLTFKKNTLNEREAERELET